MVALGLASVCILGGRVLHLSCVLSSVIAQTLHSGPDRDRVMPRMWVTTREMVTTYAMAEQKCVLMRLDGLHGLMTCNDL